MTAKLITGRCLQLLRRYDKRSESHRAALLDDVSASRSSTLVYLMQLDFKYETFLIIFLWVWHDI